MAIIGFVIGLIGLIIESVSDYEKSKEKKKNPNLPATKGLYRICRCPNYFGEILFWTGIFISGILGFKNFYEYIMAIFGYLVIIMVMISGANRIDYRQEMRYKDIEIYQEYSKKTPLLFPLIPIYHLWKVKKYYKGDKND
jgi:steroid 5-alpha reductase family enzyme